MLNAINTDQSCGISPNKLQYVYPVTYAACSTLSAWALSASTRGRNCAEELSPGGKPTLPFDTALLAYAATSLGCFGQDFFKTESEESMQNIMEENLLNAIQGLDLSKDEDIADLLKIMDTASSMGMENVVDAGKDAWSNRGSGGSE